jgi:phosphoglycolate phosphatase-like HAD superfamily hydrolase
MPKSKIVVMWDWDGTLADTMPDHADLAAMCINAYFGMSIPEARVKYLDTAGVPFDHQLEKIFPLATFPQREACAKEYHKRKMTYVYGNPKDFPQVEMVVRRLRNNPNIIQVISSSTEEVIIDEWVKKTKNNMYLVLGRESGSKKDHIFRMKKEFPEAVIIFVSDSFGDMSLPVDMTFGVDVPSSKLSLFTNNNAAIVSHLPVRLLWMKYCFNRIGVKV